jgi:hypothetical protein
MIFEGRTPCRDFAGQYGVKVGAGCHKLKWGLILLRDVRTGEPTRYTLRTTLNRAHTIEGKWAIIRGTPNNPGAVVYRLDPDKFAGEVPFPEESIFFLVGDENVLFLLDKNGRLFTGDENFSYTLNRKTL